MELGEDGTFRRTDESDNWNGETVARKETCSLDVKCLAELVALLEKVKRTFAGRTKRKFSQTEDYNFMPEEIFEEILDMKEAQLYFFPQLCLDYDKYPRRFEMRCRDGKSSNYLRW